MAHMELYIYIIDKCVRMWVKRRNMSYLHTHWSLTLFTGSVFYSTDFKTCTSILSLNIHWLISFSIVSNSFCWIVLSYVHYFSGIYTFQFHRHKIPRALIQIPRYAIQFITEFYQLFVFILFTKSISAIKKNDRKEPYDEAK